MKIKKVFFTILFALIFILILQNKAEATQKLNNLDFQVQINSDGSMDVTETWDIYVSDTNTLFKTFKTDYERYSNIIDVTVKEITGGESKDFTQIYEEMYHVTKDCYYGLKKSDGDFEIAWGVGLDNSSEDKVYEISYKVTDAIAKYNDYAELYWQFLGDYGSIPADKITGTILLPYNANSENNILCWGHIEDLNGTIYVTGLNEITFEVTNYSGENYLEVRSLFPKEMIVNSNRTYNYDIFNQVIEEETIWAEEANARRELKEKFVNSINRVFAIIGGLCLVIIIIKLLKNINKLKNMENKFKPTTEYEYYRELPYEDATPAEALFIKSYCSPYFTGFANSFPANILDLCLEKYITLEVIEKKSAFSEGVIKITLLDKDEANLKEDEKITLDFLKEVAKDNKELTTKDITKYLKRKPSSINKLDKSLKEVIENFAEKTEKYNKENAKIKNKLSVKQVLNFVVLFIIFWFAMFLFSLISSIGFGIGIIVICLDFILQIANMIVIAKISGKLNILTQTGVDEKNKWDAFQKYMEDFSLLKEKEIPALVLWEKYLVFATAFGISEKVLKQLKIVYPQIDDINSSMYSTFAYIHIMDSVDFSSCVSSSVYSAVSSSGSGSGGGFSGGGGGGRRPEEALEVASCLIVWGRFQNCLGSVPKIKQE